MRLCLSRVAVLSLIPVAVAIAGCNTAPPAQAPSTSEVPAAAPALSQVERGKNLINGGGCHDCHTPKKLTPAGPEADLDRQLSGHPESAGVPKPFPQPKDSPYTTHTNDHLTAWSGAWGVSFAANLTPDQNTGLGIWTEDMFVKALRTGKHYGVSRPILPPMPWPAFRNLTDDDLEAVFTYLQSIPPVRNRVPDPIVIAFETVD